MNSEIKEKLIEMVRQYPCIYDLKNKEYKNIVYKNMLWEKIGTTIGVQGSMAKNTWRTLRDGYIRHKKIVKGQTGSGRKYSTYTWSSQMSFLDGSLELRATDSNITEPTRPAQSPSPQRPLSPFSSQLETLRSPLHTDNDTGLANTLRHLHNLTSKSSPTQPSESSSPESAESQLTQSQPPLRKRKSNMDNNDNAERVLEYLRNKKKREWDSVDYLFMSYAKTFKALPTKNQCKIKIELAKLFAEAESDALNQSNAQPESQSQVIYLSPTYSVISDFGEQEQDQAEVPPQIYLNINNEADEAVDLSNLST